MEAGLAHRGGCARVGGSTILSTVPANSTTGVNPNLAVKFTFSEAMNPSLTTLQFFDSMAPTTHLTTTPAWSAGQNTYGQARTPRPSTCVARWPARLFRSVTNTRSSASRLGPGQLWLGCVIIRPPRCKARKEIISASAPDNFIFGFGFSRAGGDAGASFGGCVAQRCTSTWLPSRTIPSLGRTILKVFLRESSHRMRRVKDLGCRRERRPR